MGNSDESIAVRLRQYFTEAIADHRIGGAEVLQELSDLANACIIDNSSEQDSVAFALSIIFAQHAEDRDDRLVTAADTYQLIASGGEHLSEAVKFIAEGGSSDDATRIISALARLTPDRLNERWPPDTQVR